MVQLYLLCIMANFFCHFFSIAVCSAFSLSQYTYQHVENVRSKQKHHYEREMTCPRCPRQLCDLFSNMRGQVGRQVLRKNRDNTIRDAILTCARKPTYVSLIYRTETTTDETTSTCSATCSSGHFWQQTVRRSTSYM